ncbi:phosphate regulon sensor histidine kinase PhoR [Sulfuriferula nivalis]|uniref:Phosphate regulon sensor protein PhoR n=1 Tax=Sulfuriferula nivalis TaxID=2675298 RepID=A0A809RLC5_9PROT|nr:phosphate regulon sensor histidine kinase PhoR [Sulfuriferula nivalis]BBP01604.1 phosphate regulon sensor histidine kinase PhoR [Sulfuriferula nivalis]
MDFWWRPILALSALLFAALVVALFWGATVALLVLVAGLLLYIGYNLRQMDVLVAWLAHGDRNRIPTASGAWDEIFYGLDRILRRQKRNTSKISAVLERFEHAAQAIPDGIVMLNGNDQIDWFNPAASRHYGLDDKSDRGQFIGYLIRQIAFAEYLASDNYSEPLVMKSPNDKEVTLSVQMVPFGDRQKMLISRDITQLELVDAMRRDFVANVSHELRTPLTVVGGFLETFLDMGSVEPVAFHKYCDLMQQQTERMRRLVDDLLTLSRLESSQNKLVDAPVNMTELIQDLYQDAQSLSAGRHTISLAMNSTDNLMGNADELTSALGNLVSNAVRYTPAGGTVELIWEWRGDQLCFSVKDSGEGIEAQHIARLTERFYRVDRGRSRETGGTGLGLAIVKHVLTRHQARLVIESKVGYGSCFRACFPKTRVVKTVAAPALALVR